MERPLLDPQLLQSFVAIVETGSFTRAAERIHLTQSTLSQQMRRLELQLGCTLLDRSGRDAGCRLARGGAAAAGEAGGRLVGCGQYRHAAADACRHHRDRERAGEQAARA